MAIALSGTISEDDKKKQQINEYCNYIITNHNRRRLLILATQIQVFYNF